MRVRSSCRYHGPEEWMDPWYVCPACGHLSQTEDQLVEEYNRLVLQPLNARKFQNGHAATPVATAGWQVPTCAYCQCPVRSSRRGGSR